MKKIILIILVLASHVFVKNIESDKNFDLISILADTNQIRSSGFNLRHYIKHLKIILSGDRIIPQLIESIDTNYSVNYFETRSMLNSSYDIKYYFFGCELVQCLEGIIASDSNDLKGYEQITTRYSGLNDGMRENIDKYFALKAEALLGIHKSTQDYCLQFYEELSEQEKAIITFIDKYLKFKYVIHIGAFSELDYSDLIELKSIYTKWWQEHKHKTMKVINENFKLKGSPLTKTKYYNYFY